jgi:ABC-2 type transport system permease protein
MKYFTLAAKTAQIYLNKEFAYKANFIIMMLGIVINDLIGPMLALIIYGTTVGIPGWTFEQFLLFQGTLIFVYGTGRALAGDFFWKAFEAINRGEFDKYLLKPYNSWLYLMAMGIDWNGFFEAVLGAIIIIYTMTKLHISVLSLAAGRPGGHDADRMAPHRPDDNQDPQHIGMTEGGPARLAANDIVVEIKRVIP